jgi:hypothetical protein
VGTHKKEENMKATFGKELCKRLVDHYGRMPSAAVVARDFNFRSPHLAPISQETARRWIRGLSVPEIERLSILATWLKIDVKEIFQSSTQEHPQGSGMINRPFPLGESQTSSGLSSADQRLVQICATLDDKAKQLIVMLAQELAARRA